MNKIILIGIIMMLLVVLSGCTEQSIYEEQNSHEEQGSHENNVVYPANVVIDSFVDYVVLHISEPGIDRGFGHVDVTFGLKNTGDQVAREVSCFIRCYDQNTVILFAQLFTFDDLDYNEIISGNYDVPIFDNTWCVTHRIEVRWSPQKVTEYMKWTDV